MILTLREEFCQLSLILIIFFFRNSEIEVNEVEEDFLEFTDLPTRESAEVSNMSVLKKGVVIELVLECHSSQKKPISFIIS